MNTTTRRFNFYKEQSFEAESIEQIGKFITDHIDVDLVNNCYPERGVLNSTTKIIITIGYEKADKKDRKNEQNI